uniref:T-complex protein 1 subunit theta n=2 Tax=Lygus hesperus TaxID=30085 RepID=A0A0A9W6L5_LYGHE
MAMHVPKAPGFAQMLKDGARHFSGLEEAVLRNISACKEFADTVRTAYGPNGMNKIVINHIDKLFVTNDAATIIKELEVEHPAAKIMILSSQMQEEEIGDGTNFVIILAGALLQQAIPLLKMGMTPIDIIEGYQLALAKALDVLPSLVCHEIKDVKNEEDVSKAIRASIMSKQYGHEDFLTKIITKACIAILPDESTFNVDNIRVCKILGSGLLNSESVYGMVFKRHVEGSITKKHKAKIAIYSCPIDNATTETKGTVLIKTADELMKFSEGEESRLESQIKAIKEAGVDVVVGGGKFSDMALHFINKAGLMAVRLNSKFDVRRLCQSTGAVALPLLTPPSKEELGYADTVYVDELGDTSIVVFKMEGKDSRISTIVIRGSTENYMDDIERSVDDGVNTFKGLSRDGRFLPGAGAVEIELARIIRGYANEVPGLERYAVARFAEALETFPTTLAENTGLKSRNVIRKLHEAHKDGKGPNIGVQIDLDSDELTVDSNEAGIWDLFKLKEWGLKFACTAATTILRVDQIIMAKRAGGPAPKAPKAGDEDD